MPRRLPPLNALRAFEAAARHLSFSRAAQELHVTHSAVSHQVKALEEFLGVKLFRRLTRAVRLTDAGQTYLPVLRDALDRIADVTERLRADVAAGPLTVSVTPAFAIRWLVPRLGRFYQAHPDIDVRVSPSVALVDFARDDVDVAVRYGPGNWPGVRAEHLLKLDRFPVCSSKFVDGPHGLRTPRDLGRHTLLHDELRDDWRGWLLAAGVEGIDLTRGPTFSETSLLLQAAVAGLGIAIADSALVADDLASGRLVKPFDIALPAEFGYFVVCPEAAFERPKIAAFREWLIAEAERANESGGPSKAAANVAVTRSPIFT